MTAAIVNYKLPHFDPLWAAISDANLPITPCLDRPRSARRARQWRRGGELRLALAVAHHRAVANLCASGVLERFPNIRFATIEGRHGWVTWLLDAMDEPTRSITSGCGPRSRPAQRLLSRARLLVVPGRTRPGSISPETQISTATSCGPTTIPSRRHLAAFGRGHRAHHGPALRQGARNVLGLKCARFLGIGRAAALSALRPDSVSKRTLRGKAAIAGVGETTYYRHGKATVSEFKLALQAILAACEDAGRPAPHRRLRPPTQTTATKPSRLAAALGLPALRFSNMNWGGGGGGGSAAMGNAAAAVACGMANCVVVFRALAQASSSASGCAPGRCRRGRSRLQRAIRRDVAGAALRHAGDALPAREQDQPSAQRAIALASYHHAQSNPRAVMHGPSAHRRGLRPVALDRRAVAAVRLLPGE